MTTNLKIQDGKYDCSRKSLRNYLFYNIPFLVNNFVEKWEWIVLNYF